MAVRVEGAEGLKAMVGKHIGETDWMEITQDRVNQFADATGDHQWIHVDPERAKDGPFGGPIAHGYLTLSLVSKLLPELWDINYTSGVNYGLNKLRFPAPVKVGAKVRLSADVVEVEDLAGGGAQVILDARMEVEGSDKPSMVAQVVYRYFF